MPQFAWPAFTADRKDRHLVVIDVPARVTVAEPAALVRRLIEDLQLIGDLAMSAEQTDDGTRILCAFARPDDASSVIEALNAEEDNRESGWASQHRCVLDAPGADSLVGARGSRRKT
jgi:hypothetical protein